MSIDLLYMFGILNSFVNFQYLIIVDFKHNMYYQITTVVIRLKSFVQIAQILTVNFGKYDPLTNIGKCGIIYVLPIGTLICYGDGIGRRMGLKNLRWQHRGGSNPFRNTTDSAKFDCFSVSSFFVAWFFVKVHLLSFLTR